MSGGEIEDRNEPLGVRLEWPCGAFGGPTYNWYKNGVKLVRRYSKIGACLGCFLLGEFVRANSEKRQLDWLAMNIDVITSQSHSLLACSGNGGFVISVI